MTSPPPPTPPLLAIPLELRHLIYSHLIPPSPLSHPLPSIGITSVSHTPPSIRLLRINRQITSEILDYFYALTTWKLVFSHAFNFFRVDPDLTGLERSEVLRRMRKVEVVFFCDVLLVKGWDRGGRSEMSGGDGRRASGRLPLEDEVRRKAERAVDVLLLAKELRTVVVSWIDTTGNLLGGVDGQQASMLEPLRRLRGRVGFKVGRAVLGPGALQSPLGEREALASVLGGVLGAAEHGMPPSRVLLDGASEYEVEREKRRTTDQSDPATLRHLAFDPRQERDLYAMYTDPGTEPVRSIGPSVVTNSTG
ncbi:hypothetical protein LTR09_005556 [Extremus antarcticus]|uniref:Uncharacterized protein n=1 Tax=Extremus antarcticus TaxID=702011 RepID=A0AAJ0GCA8_9PEZI|nr:hypothetical protein LTR09_005556 [Extremus antarcticus]